MTSSSPHHLRTALGAITFLLALAALLAAAAPAAAAKSCGEKVIDDWYADGRVDGTYAPHCYDDAIEALPRDVRDYSSAKDDISRALQARLRNEPAPPARTDPTPGDGKGPSEDGTPPTDTTTDPVDTTAALDDEGDGDGEEDNEAAPPIDGESASSIPIPLLILAGLALLLVAGGSAGYLIRRYQARQVTPPAL